MAVGRRLRAARERLGLSQRALAFPGCSPGYLSRIEAGARIPSLPLLRELSRRLDVSVDHLATGREAPADQPSHPRLDDAEIALRLDEIDEAERLFADVRAEADEPRARSAALEGLGQIALRQGKPDRAVMLFEEALLVAQVEDASERPLLAASLAKAHASLGQLPQSIAVLRQCVERYQDDPIQYVRFAGYLVAALADSGSFAEAERVLVTAQRRGRNAADPYTRARLSWSEYKLHGDQGNNELAERCAGQALETLRATEDTFAVARLSQGLAHVYLDQDRPAEALELLREVWPAIAASASPLEAAQFRLEEARALTALGEPEAAGAIALEVSSSLSGVHPVDSGRVYTTLAEIYQRLGERARARELLELAVELLESRGPSRYLINAYKSLALLLEELGDTAEALQVLKRVFAVQEQAGRWLR